MKNSSQMTLNFQSTVRDTSVESYKSLLPSMGYEQQQVYDYLFERRMMGLGPLTDREITKNMGRSDPNTVRPRRNELTKMGWVLECPKRVCSISGKLVYTWAVNDLVYQFRTMEDVQ